MKRQHNCAGSASKRDAEGYCRECGVPLDEEGYEVVDEKREARLKRLAKGEPIFEDVLAVVHDPDLKEIIERMNRHGEPSPK